MAAILRDRGVICDSGAKYVFGKVAFRHRGLAYGFACLSSSLEENREQSGRLLHRRAPRRLCSVSSLWPAGSLLRAQHALNHFTRLDFSTDEAVAAIRALRTCGHTLISHPSACRGPCSCSGSPDNFSSPLLLSASPVLDSYADYCRVHAPLDRVRRERLCRKHGKRRVCSAVRWSSRPIPDRMRLGYAAHWCDCVSFG